MAHSWPGPSNGIYTQVIIRFVAGALENNYDESLATIKGRFWYVQLKKSF